MSGLVGVLFGVVALRLVREKGTGFVGLPGPETCPRGKESVAGKERSACVSGFAFVLDIGDSIMPSRRLPSTRLTVDDEMGRERELDGGDPARAGAAVSGLERRRRRAHGGGL